MPFRDIDNTHKYFKSISALYARGAVKGITNYSMAPNRKITLGEAGTIAVMALGYDITAQTGVTSFYAQAVDLNLFDDISGGQNDGLDVYKRQTRV